MWIERNGFGARNDSPIHGNIIFLSSAEPPGSRYNPTPNVWHQTDVTTVGVPVDAYSVFISGLLIITHGLEPQDANITIAFRAPGNTSINPDSYCFQTAEGNIGGGQRSTCGTWVPVVGGKIEWAWRRGDAVSTPDGDVGHYPQQSTFGANLNITAYVR